jgi:phosphohistidine swiveling domain-containing protein
MNWVRPLEDIQPEDRSRVGGKCFALAQLQRHGFRVPDGVCICVEAYRSFIDETGLGARIHFELNRKSFDDMRWEEIWDTSLRIRSMFAGTPMPAAIGDPLGDAIGLRIGDRPVAVRSSALGEDEAGVSFAGLHESYINVVGADSILDKVKLVWASLWSDRALLYRKELGLDIQSSAMAVVVQVLVAGETSGVAFSRNPNDTDQAVVEAVYGLNQALVDGTVEPDRWLVDRASGSIISHAAPERMQKMVVERTQVRMVPLGAEARAGLPLSDNQLRCVIETVLRAEHEFGAPQDVEWTIKQGEVYLLQARPITTVSAEPGDDRSWYLSLTRSFENLKSLRTRIEDEILPGMDADAAELADAELGDLSDQELAGALEKRMKIRNRWVKTYWEECIPFAHGMRLFGQVYNDVIKPQDPYEFMTLLSAEPTLSLDRNRLLEQMAVQVRTDPDLRQALEIGGPVTNHEEFRALLDGFLSRFGLLSGTALHKTAEIDIRKATLGLVLELAGREPAGGPRPGPGRGALEQAYLGSFEESRRGTAAELLDLARASYRLRDDDNIYLARVEAELARAVDAARARLGPRLGPDPGPLDTAELVKALRDSGYVPVPGGPEQAGSPDGPRAGLKARQLTGQPAGPGIGSGRARIVVDQPGLFAFRAGEVLVCDAIEPEMTFVVPLASGIVERRGGMLIHGAIIAREYGIPCVTGVPDATELIRTGDYITVDGYLGIVIVG